MKNIHIIPTDKPSRLVKGILSDKLLLADMPSTNKHYSKYSIYLTSDEEFKDGDWCLDIFTKSIFKYGKGLAKGQTTLLNATKKIILTTDTALNADGVQEIDNKFLKWFVKNPSCENVEVVKEGFKKNDMIDEATSYKYKIIIPQEEPSTKLHKGEVVDGSYPKVDENKKNLYYYKQAMNPYSAEEYSHTAYEKGFIEGYQKSTKWQQEQDNIANEILEYILLNDDGVGIALGYNSKEMIENYFKRINYEK
jgi:hypothetical protein